MIFRQLFDGETSTYTYILGDPDSREAIIIDSVDSQVDRDLQMLSELNLQLKYILDTHVHADHITGADLLRERTGAKVGLSSAAETHCADIPLDDGEALKFGAFEVTILATPGHTNTCTSYVCGDKIFTGDALLIRGCGRTDFQEGSSKQLFTSVRDKIFKLDDSTYIYPGHDYKGCSVSTVGEEKTYNPRLGLNKTESEFIEIMENLKLAPPMKIHEAVPLNLKCGKRR